MYDEKLYADVRKIYFKRLHILIARSGLEWVTDLRDRRSWQRAFDRERETAVMSEIPPEAVYEDMICFMVKNKCSLLDISDILNRIMGIKFNMITDKC